MSETEQQHKMPAGMKQHSTQQSIQHSTATVHVGRCELKQCPHKQNLTQQGVELSMQLLIQVTTKAACQWHSSRVLAQPRLTKPQAGQGIACAILV
jgi:hypothetical protein